MTSKRLCGARALPALTLLLAAGVCLLPSSQAATRALTADGVLHSIVVEPRQVEASGLPGTRLVHHREAPDQSVEAIVIPGTDDAAFDVEPSLTLDPRTGYPSIAWSRQVGTSYEIFASSFDGVRWCPIRQVTSNTREDRNAQAVVSNAGYLHLIWASGANPDSSPIFYEAVLDLKGVIVLPPLVVQAPLHGTVTPQDDSVPSSLVGPRVLFAFNASPKNGLIVACFGGQDEPIPVDRRVDFVPPSGVGPIENPRVEVIGDGIAVMFRASSRLYYSIQAATGWTPIRSLSLSALTEEQAEIVIRTMAEDQAAP